MNPLPQFVTPLEAWMFITSLLFAGAGMGIAFAAWAMSREESLRKLNHTEYETMITQDWKDIGNKLPKDDATVMVFCPDHDEAILLAYHDGHHWRSIENAKFPEEITHWCELPEPPDLGD